MQRNDILKLLFETPYEALRERADEVRAREKGEQEKNGMATKKTVIFLKNSSICWPFWDGIRVRTRKYSPFRSYANYSL